MKNSSWLFAGFIAASLLTACGASSVAPPKGETPTQAMADVIAATAMKGTRLYVATAYITNGSFSVVNATGGGESICGVSSWAQTGCTGSISDVVTNPALSTKYARTLTYKNYGIDSVKAGVLTYQIAVNGSSQYTVSAYVGESDNTRRYAFDLTFGKDLAALGQVAGTATCTDVSVFVDTSCTFEFPNLQLVDKEFFGNRFTMNADLQGIAGRTALSLSNWNWNAGKTIDQTATVKVTTAGGMTAVVKGSDSSVVTVDITIAGVTTTFSSTLR